MSKILIIAADDSVRKKLKDRIEAMGHETEEAECFQTAVKWLDKSTFDCVLLDLCNLVKFEGVGRIKNGKPLFQRFRNGHDNPAVLYIVTCNNQGRSMETMEIEASHFVIQPFDESPIEPKIEEALSQTAQQKARSTFKGGALMLSKDGIEFRGQIVGGVKGNAYIRRIIEILGQKTAKGEYRKISAKELAKTIGAKISPAVITSAIRDFRHDCCDRLECGENDVIQTNPHGGYQLAPGIEFQVRKDRPVTQLEKDKQAVLRQIQKHGRRTRRQISENTGIPILQLKRALSSLIDEHAFALTGSGRTATYDIPAKTNPKRKL